MMMTNVNTESRSLVALLEGLTSGEVPAENEIMGLTNDSRKIKHGDLFIAYPGQQTNGIQYINDALQSGATAIAIDADADTDDMLPDCNVPMIPVRGLKEKLGVIASRFYDYPSRDLDIVGITGTNGKTTVSYFIANVLSSIQKRPVGLIGTLGIGIYGRLESGVNTTPDPLVLQEQFYDLKKQGARNVVMEISSQGLVQGRVNSIDFSIAIFTNLTEEHLDYHGDMDSYAEAKKGLFLMPGLKQAIINTDDEYGDQLAREMGNLFEVIEYGLGKDESCIVKGNSERVMAKILNCGVDQLSLDINSPWGKGVLHASIGGKFNAYNLLASLAALCLLDVPFERAMQGLSRVKCVPGRMEIFRGDKGPLVIVDYAHTPDALKNALSSIRQSHSGHLICVFGCGGNRDKGKRPQMGSIAESYADRLVLTNDNPRSEDPQAILSDILAGIKNKKMVEVELDREKAMTTAIRNAGVQDIVLIAGKGHETYQEIAGERYPFDDRELARKLLEGFS